MNTFHASDNLSVHDKDKLLPSDECHEDDRQG